MNDVRVKQPQTIRSGAISDEIDPSIHLEYAFLNPIYSLANRVVGPIYSFFHLNRLRKYESFTDDSKLGSVMVLGSAIGLVGGIHLCLAVQLLIGAIRGEQSTPLVRDNGVV